MFITPLYGAVFGLFYVLLGFNVIRLRMTERVAYGDAGNKDLVKAIRIHANFAEYVPFALVLMWFVETMTFSTTPVFWYGAVLLLGRVLHVFGMAYPKTMMLCRQLGMIATFAVILIASITLIIHYMPISV